MNITRIVTQIDYIMHVECEQGKEFFFLGVEWLF